MSSTADRVVPLLKNREYLLLWGGQVVSTLGSSASAVIYPLLILALTHSPEVAGVASALRVAPYLLLSLPAGALIDRWNRRRVMILCDIGRALAVGTIPVALFAGVLTVMQINVVSLIEGSLFVFFNLAEVAALPRVVAREQLPQATAQNEASFGLANVVGPSFGTALFSALGQAAPFIADAVSYLVSAFALSKIRTPFHVTQPLKTKRKLIADIGEGLRWLLGQRLISLIAVITGNMNFVNAAFPLILIVLARAKGASDGQIGLIFSSAGVGGILGALMGGWIRQRLSFYRVITGVLWIQVLLIVALMFAPNVLAIAAINAAFLLLQPIYNVTQFSYRVALIPDALQGRVNSVFRLFAFGFMPLGALLSGYLIEHFGVELAIEVSAIVLVATALLGTFNQAMRSAQHHARATS